MTDKFGMKCPVCNETLNISERQNVEIDFCPKCRGVWLDRGELDKIIDRAAKEMIQPAPQNSQAAPYGGYGKHGGHGHRGYRRKSWLHEIFD
jgi:uncharacterized protein